MPWAESAVLVLVAEVVRVVAVESIQDGMAITTTIPRIISRAPPKIQPLTRRRNPVVLVLVLDRHRPTPKTVLSAGLLVRVVVVVVVSEGKVCRLPVPVLARGRRAKTNRPRALGVVLRQDRARVRDKVRTE